MAFTDKMDNRIGFCCFYLGYRPLLHVADIVCDRNDKTSTS